MELLTISEAAGRLGVSIEALRRWSNAGLVPYTRLPGGGHRRWSREQLEAIRAKMTQPIAAEAAS